MTRPLDLVVIGLSLSSSWGNGHATTYRARLRGLDRLGHRVTFLERDVPWYGGANRDLADPDFCSLRFYRSLADLDEHAPAIRAADAVIVGSYVPDGMAVLDRVLALARGPVVFYDIDTPVTLAALARGDCDFLAAAQIPRLDLYLSFSGGPILDRLRQDYGAPAAEPLHCSVEESAYRPTGEPVEWDLGYLGTYSPDRQPKLDALLLEPARNLPHRRFVVAGPEYPADVDWPPNVERIEHLAPADHASFYCRQRWTLNVTRADMVAAGWSPSVRLFEAAACGTPIVSDPWPGLGDLLPEGEAIVTAGNTETVIALLSGDKAEEEARRQSIAERARSLVLDAHTGTARAGQLVDALSRAADRRANTRQDDVVRQAAG